MIIDVPWGYTLVCLLLGGLYTAVLYFVRPNPSFGKWGWMLSALRMLSVSGIAFLLLAPVSRQTVHEQQKPLIAIVEDHSLSVQQGADSAFSTASLQHALSEKYRLLVVADTIHTQQTDIAQMLTVPPDAAAVVLASDGLYNRGSNPTPIAERLGIPVYTLALGDTTPQHDATIADLRTNRIAMLGTPFPVELTVNATRLAGCQSILTISNADGQTVYSHTLSYTDNDYSTRLSFTLPADKAGLQRFAATLSPAAGETITSNNTATFYVDIIDAYRKVAIIAHVPHPDISAIKRAIESNPNYEVALFFANDIENGKSPFHPTDYQMAILHNLPSTVHPNINYTSSLPRLFVIGLQTSLLHFNALHTGLEIATKIHRADEVTAHYHDGFSLFAFPPDEADIIASLPPLLAPFGQAQPSASLQTLFTAQLGTLNTPQPLVAANAHSPQRQAFVWGEGLWRWRLEEYALHSSHTATDHLLSQLVAFAAMQHQQGRLRVEAARSYSSGENPLLRAQLYNETYEPFNDAEVALHLVGDSVEADFAFQREGNGYRLPLPCLPEGLYRYRATTPDGLADEGTFAVETSYLELQCLTADHALLRSISAASGGQTFHPSQTDGLLSALAHLKPTIHTHTRYAEFLNLPLVLSLLILLLGAEWVLRKYHGGL